MDNNITLNSTTSDDSFHFFQFRARPFEKAVKKDEDFNLGNLKWAVRDSNPRHPACKPEILRSYRAPFCSNLTVQHALKQTVYSFCQHVSTGDVFCTKAHVSVGAWGRKKGRKYGLMNAGSNHAVVKNRALFSGYCSRNWPRVISSAWGKSSTSSIMTDAGLLVSCRSRPAYPSVASKKYDHTDGNGAKGVGGRFRDGHGTNNNWSRNSRASAP